MNTSIDIQLRENSFSSLQFKLRHIATHDLGRYYLGMLFYKYISDYWKEKHKEYSRLYSDSELVSRKMSRERFILEEHLLFDKLAAQRNNPNIGEIINSILFKIERLNAPQFDGIFSQLDYNNEYNLGGVKDRNLVLVRLIYAFEEINLGPSNPSLNDIIDFLLTGIGLTLENSGRSGIEFFTPLDICSLLAQLLQPESGNRICDPFCGSGSLLIEAAKSIKNLNGSPSNDYALYGQDLNKEILGWAKINMYLRGLDGFQLASGDVISSPAWVAGNDLMKFDVIISNPPFNVNHWNIESVQYDPYYRFKWGKPPAGKGDYAFIQHMLSSLNEKGRMGIIISHGVLFREGAEQEIRKAIVENNLLEAVIGLPPNMFFSMAVPCAIMIFNKNKSTNNVLFINATEGYLPSKQRNSLRPVDIEKIVLTYKLFKSSADKGNLKKFSQVYNPKIIAANNYNLNIAKYVSSYEEEPMINQTELKKEIFALEKELETIKQDLHSNLIHLGLM